MAPRPPVDTMPNEIFFDKKCGKGKDHDTFFKWCAKPNDTERIHVVCEGISGSMGYCDAEVWFGFEGQRSGNFTFFDSQPKPNSTTIPSIIPKGRLPTKLNWKIICSVGPEKKALLTVGDVRIAKKVSEDIVTICRQELYGPEQGWPLWLILLVIFILIVALTIAGSLFWTYWLKRKIYGPQPGEPLSTLGSRWTSVPISGVSSVAPAPSDKPNSGSNNQSGSGLRSMQAPVSLRTSRPSTGSRQSSVKMYPSIRSVSLSGASPSRSKRNR